MWLVKVGLGVVPATRSGRLFRDELGALKRRQRLPEQSGRWRRDVDGRRSINGVVVTRTAGARMGVVCSMQQQGVEAGDARANSWHCARQPFARRDPTSVLR